MGLGSGAGRTDEIFLEILAAINCPYFDVLIFSVLIYLEKMM